MSITLDHVSYIYDMDTAMASTALDDVNAEIPDGRFIGLIGHTGSGKSTLVQLLNGLLKPSKGRVLYNGEDINAEDYDRRVLRSKVGIVFQYPEHQLFEETVIKDVCFGPQNLGLSEEECLQRAKEALAQVGLPEETYESSPFDLSGGQKRRAAIAGVIAMHPQVLILDEPTAGLDPAGRDEILDLISGMHKDLGMTIVLVSHSMEDVAKYVEQIMVMDRGKMIFNDVPTGVFAQYKKLEEVGLAAPQITYIMNLLKEKGLDVRTDILSVDEAAGEILRAMEGRHV